VTWFRMTEMGVLAVRQMPTAAHHSLGDIACQPGGDLPDMGPLIEVGALLLDVLVELNLEVDPRSPVDDAEQVVLSGGHSEEDHGRRKDGHSEQGELIFHERGRILHRDAGFSCTPCMSRIIATPDPGYSHT